MERTNIENGYEQERNKLIEEIVEGLSESITRIQTLNRNLEHLVEVGQEFEIIAKVWNNFQNNLVTQSSSSNKDTDLAVAP